MSFRFFTIKLLRNVLFAPKKKTLNYDRRKNSYIYLVYLFYILHKILYTFQYRSIPSVHFVAELIPFAYCREFTGFLNTTELYTDSRLLGVLAGARVKLLYGRSERLIGSSQTSRVCLRVSRIPSNLGVSSTGRKRLVPGGTEHPVSN